MKTMIDTVAHAVTEGKVLVGGVAYTIKRGKTMKDGVAYEIGGNTPIPVTITGTGSSIYCYIIVDGTNYWSAGNAIEVKAGDIIKLCAGSSGITATASITIDGTSVWQGKNESYTYEWTVPNGITSIVINLSFTMTLRVQYGHISLTTE